MLSATSKYRFRVILAILLSLCLSSAATESQRTDAWDDAGSKEVLYTFVTTNAPSVLLAAGEQTRLHGFDKPVSVFHGQTHLVFDKEFSLLHSGDSAEVTNCNCPSVIPIRAPPFRHA